MKLPPGLETLLRDLGAEITSTRNISYGSQYRLQRSSESAILNVYSTGKVVVQGKNSDLKSSLEGWTGTSGAGRGSRAREGARSALDATPRIGIDESGKGDYFGPLVVAGVRVLGENAAKALRELNVRDSKKMESPAVRRTAACIPEAVGNENIHVLALSPREYETRRTRSGNINLLLDELDAEIISKLKAEVKIIVVDQYAASARKNLAPFVPDGVRLEVRARAEDDAAVAAASIVARARYLEEMERLSERVGFALPLGATHVVDAGRRVYEERGMEGLREVAKVSFRTTRKVTGG